MNGKAVEEAVRAVLQAVQRADGEEMMRGRPRKMELEVEMGGEGGEGGMMGPGPHGPEHETEEMALIEALEKMHGGDEDDDGQMMRPGMGNMMGRGRY